MESWAFEVIDDDGGLMVWYDLFDTDQVAHAEFFVALERENIACFRQAPFDTHLN
jgi:hypothetical protein